MIRSQQERRLAALEEQLVPPVRYVIFTGVPRPDGSPREIDDGYSAVIVCAGPDELENAAEQKSVVNEVLHAIGFDALPEPEIGEPDPATVATPVPIIEPPPAPAAAPPQPNPWQPLVRERAPEPAFRPYRGRYSWMR